LAKLLKEYWTSSINDLDLASDEVALNKINEQSEGILLWK